MKSQIFKLRKQIYSYFRNRAQELETRSDELNAYSAEQNESAKRKFSIVDLDRILKKVTESDIIYLGDFHTFDQNIRNVLRIIKHLVSHNKKCILGLEMIHADKQMFIDTYLEHHITDLEFLDSIHYHDSWRFPWTHYKLIFELAREHNIKVVALNTEGTLKQRDSFAGDIIAKTHLENPEMPQIILYGELHITKTKIPAMVKNLIPDIQQTIIHQNLDEVYWKLIEEDCEQGIVEFSEDEFCLISAPPWVKYESMIYWYENLCNDPDFDIHEYIIENGKKTFSDDTQDQFLSICVELNENLNLELQPSDLENFNLYDHSSLEFIEEQLEQTLEQKELDFYQYLLATGKSFNLPHTNMFYCSSYSMNRISYLAGIHIFSLLNSHQVSTAKAFDDKAYFFIKFCYESQLAFFFSKIINPHRKCDMFQDLVLRESTSQNIFEKQFLSLSLDILRTKKLPDHFQMANNVIYESAILIGHITGEYLYQSLALPMTHHNIKNFIENLEFKPRFFNLQFLASLLHKDYLSHRKRTF